MPRDPRAYLWDMPDAAASAQSFVGGLSLEDYLKDALRRSAAERQLLILGEALAQLSKADAAVAAQVPEQSQIIGFRNIVVHGYALLNHQRVWNVVQADVPPLLLVLDALLASLGPPDQP